MIEMEQSADAILQAANLDAQISNDPSDSEVDGSSNLSEIEAKGAGEITEEHIIVEINGGKKPHIASIPLTSRSSHNTLTDEDEQPSTDQNKDVRSRDRASEVGLAKHDTNSKRELNNKLHCLDENILEKGESTFSDSHDKINLKRERKRKRKSGNDDLESEYMQKLAKLEEKESKEREAKRKNEKVQKEIREEEVEGLEPNNLDRKVAQKLEVVDSDIPKHESVMTPNFDVEIAKASRTVFLGNVSTLAISSKKEKKALLSHMGSFFSDLASPPDGTPPHKVESIRFRSTPYTESGLPKRAAFAKKELMVATTKSTNAYVVYSNAYAAREAVKRLNGSIILDRHLRVDGVAHPSKIDHLRCVFVGNLGFVDDESLLDETDEMIRKRSKIPSDIEEGLWRQFNKAGTVESVRVVRDEKTRVGKGFAYVQFTDPNSVEAALLFNEKKYPPMLPRILRVLRAKPVRKTATALSSVSAKMKQIHFKDQPIFNPKITSEKSSLHGRATKLLGRAGAAKLRSGEDNVTITRNQQKDHSKYNQKLGTKFTSRIQNTAENFIFEGHRATPKTGGTRHVKQGRKNKTQDSKPKTRSSRRATEWKKNGSNKIVK